jgi:hypothetical protein
VHDQVIISHRGAGFEIGRGQGFYAIWRAGAAHLQPIEWWPETEDGWHAAWARFTDVEVRRTIVQVSRANVQPGQPQAATRLGDVARRGRRTIVAGALIVVGIILGFAGLFPGYFGRTSLAAQAFDLVPHLIYLAAWAVSGVMILRGGAAARTGALLGAGTSVVTFGLFLADVGTVVSGGTAVRDGLTLSLIGWAAATAGSLVAIRLGKVGSPERPRGLETTLTLGLAGVAALGTAIAFAPSWDRFTLRTAAGATQSITAGNAFANPGLVIAGDIATMAALVVVVIAAASWRPIRHGAFLLAGAAIPMVAQAISAIIQASMAASPLQFGITPAQAAQAGLTISSGLTATFWIYCAFVVALALTCALMLAAPVPPPPAPVPQAATPPDANSPVTAAVDPMRSS